MSFTEEKRHKDSLMYYITDALMCISENTANGAYGGKVMSKRFYDLINYREETRTAQDIINSIRNKLGG